MKKSLVVFYSRTGMTRKVGLEIAKELGADVDEIIDLKDRSGVKGYILAGKDAYLKKSAKIQMTKNRNPEKYSLVVIGTPIWAWTMACAVRTYLTENKNKFKSVAFFCTMGGQKGKTFKEMEKISIKPEKTLALTTKEVVDNSYKKKAAEFSKGL